MITIATKIPLSGQTGSRSEGCTESSSDSTIKRIVYVPGVRGSVDPKAEKTTVGLFMPIVRESS